MITPLKIMAASLVVALASGCASQQSINADQLEGIEKVYLITETAQVKLDYQGPSVNWGMAIGGIVGGMLASQSNEPEKEAMKALLEQQNIELVEHVRAKLLKDLAGSNTRLELVDSYEESDARFFLDTVSLSFLTSNPLTGSVMPTVEVKGSLVPNGGSAIWEGDGATTIYTIETETGRSLVEWIEEPAFAQDVIIRSVDISVDGLVANYAKATSL